MSKLSTNSFLKGWNQSKIIKKIDLENTDQLNFKKEDFDIKNLKNPNNQIQNHLIKKLLDSTATCQISDALTNLTGRNGVLNNIKSINNKKTYGRIITVKTDSDDWGTSLLAIDKAKKGEILFILSLGEPSAIWGELTSQCSKEKGLSGTVIYGASRDIDFLVDFDYPVFGCETVPNAGKPLGLGIINPILEIENIKIKPGDFLFADMNGCVLVPQELFSDVMMETLKIKLKEAEIISEIKKGKSLSEILNLS
ncbi:MAG: RraA family protein [Methanobacteriaceae archaeon]|jgi:regulator of RNase E activity RraA|nr:RraA family protein [Candidatus Methanorudis spinitermitis]